MFVRENSIVFTPARMGPLEIKNRLVRSATYENAATRKGEVSDFVVDLYRTLAKGGVGLIISGIASVQSKALAPHLIIRADDDSFISSLEKIPRAVRESEPDCKVLLQLHHPGRQVLDMEKAANFFPPALLAYIQKHPEVTAVPEGTPHRVEPTAPSPVYDTTFDRTPRALTLEEIDEIIEAFAAGIRRGQEAGFHGAQLHAAHGFLLSSFLSPRTNQRVDAYGGSTENRTRIVKEIYRRARKKVGDDFPILIKINTTDFLPGGTDLNEAVRVGKVLSELGFAAIEASGGMWESLTRQPDELGWLPVLLPESRTGIKTEDQEAYFQQGAKALKEKTYASVILVGGLRSFSRIEKVLDSKVADFVSMCRPFIRQPDLPNFWRSGAGPDRSECISCNACLPLGTAPLACRAKRQ